jgi:hypothetical protein
VRESVGVRVRECVGVRVRTYLVVVNEIRVSDDTRCNGRGKQTRTANALLGDVRALHAWTCVRVCM